MEKLRLCDSCVPARSCWFDRKANAISKKVPPLEKQTLTKGALQAHQQIASLREQARDIRFCPNVSTINPDYPGRKNL